MMQDSVHQQYEQICIIVSTTILYNGRAPSRQLSLKPNEKPALVCFCISIEPSTYQKQTWEFTNHNCPRGSGGPSPFDPPKTILMRYLDLGVGCNPFLSWSLGPVDSSGPWASSFLFPAGLFQESKGCCIAPWEYTLGK